MTNYNMIPVVFIFNQPTIKYFVIKFELNNYNESNVLLRLYSVFTIIIILINNIRTLFLNA